MLQHQESKDPVDPKLDEIAKAIVNAAIEVHRELGPGLLEQVYEVCLFRELTRMGIRVERQKHIPIAYKDEMLDANLRIDLLVEDEVIVEIKAVEMTLPVHQAQVLTYMKLAKKRLGMLMNFNVGVMNRGIKRLVL